VFSHPLWYYQGIIAAFRISLISSTALIDDDFVDSDLTILENLRGRRTPTYPVVAFYWKRLCSWTVWSGITVSSVKTKLIGETKEHGIENEVTITNNNKRHRQRVIAVGTVIAAASVVCLSHLFFMRNML